MSLNVGVLEARIELDDSAFRRSVGQAGNSFQQLGRDADRSAQQIRQGYRDAGTQAERAAQGVGAAFRDAGTEAERASTGVGAEWRQQGSEAERAAGGVGDAWRQNGQEAERAAGGVGDAWRQAGQQAEDSMGDAAGAAGDAGDAGGAGFLAGFAGKIKGLAGKGGPIAAALAGVMAIGSVAGAQLAEAVVEGFGMQSEIDVTQAKLGIDDATMATVGQAAGAAYANNFGESVAANRDAVVAGFDFGLIGVDSSADDMQSLIEKTDVLNTLLETETADSLRAVSGLVKSGLVANVDEAFDLIAAGRNKGMNAQDDLIDSVSEYSAGWKQTGLSAQTTFALIKQSLDNGVDNTDRAADAIREFGRRVYEEGDTLTTTFTELGFNGEEMYQKFVKGGPEAEAAFDQVFDAIRAIEDPAKRAAAAQALLGDTAGDFIGAFTQWDPSKAVADFGSVEGAAKKAGDTIGVNAAGKIETARRVIEQAADSMKLKLAEAFAPPIGDAADWVTAHQEEILIFFAELAKTAISVTAGLLDGAGAMLQFGSMAYQAGLQVIDGFVTPITVMMSALGGVLEQVPGMKSVGQAMQDTASKTQGVIDGLKEGAENMNTAGSAMFTLADKIRNGTATIDDFIIAQQQSIAETDDQTAKTLALIDTLNLLPREKPIDISAPGGDAVRELLTQLGVKVTTDNNKNIVVESPLAPAVLDTLKKLGIEVVTNNGKSILVTSNAPAVKTDIDALNTSLNETTKPRTIDILTNYAVTGTPPPTTPGYKIGPGGQLIPRANGGPIVGPGGPKADQVPILASNGEFMMQAAAVDKYGYEFMERVNAGKYADGGPIRTPASVKQAITGLAGGMYTFGGWDGTWNTDCSGAQSKAANFATTGDTEAGGRFATANEAEALAARGYMAGQAPPGVPAIEHGWYNGGEGGGHTAGLIQDPAYGDTPFEMGGQSGDGAVGAGAASSREIGATDFAWFPLGSEDPNATGTGANLGSQSDLPSSTGASSVPSPSYGVNGAEGNAQNVFVTNWPAKIADPKVQNAVASAVFTRYATGGPITGPGTGTSDDIPLWGSNGEFMMRTAAVNKYGLGFMHAVNAGKFADGGPIGGFGGYTSPAVARVKLTDHSPAYYLEQLYRLGVAGVGGAAMISSAFSGGQFNGFSTASNSSPQLEEALGKLDELLNTPNTSVGIYVSSGGQIIVRSEDEAGKVTEQAVTDALTKSATMR